MYELHWAIKFPTHTRQYVCFYKSRGRAMRALRKVASKGYLLHNGSGVEVMHPLHRICWMHLHNPEEFHDTDDAYLVEEIFW